MSPPGGIPTSNTRLARLADEPLLTQEALLTQEDMMISGCS
jgi:hypothetical protein